MWEELKDSKTPDEVLQIADLQALAANREAQDFTRFVFTINTLIISWDGKNEKEKEEIGRLAEKTYKDFLVQQWIIWENDNLEKHFNKIADYFLQKWYLYGLPQELLFPIISMEHVSSDNFKRFRIAWMTGIHTTAYHVWVIPESSWISLWMTNQRGDIGISQNANTYIKEIATRLPKTPFSDITLQELHRWIKANELLHHILSKRHPWRESLHRNRVEDIPWPIDNTQPPPTLGELWEFLSDAASIESYPLYWLLVYNALAIFDSDSNAGVNPFYYYTMHYMLESIDIAYHQRWLQLWTEIANIKSWKWDRKTLCKSILTTLGVEWYKFIRERFQSHGLDVINAFEKTYNKVKK